MNEQKANRNMKLIVSLLGLAILFLIVLLLIFVNQKKDTSGGNLAVDITATDVSVQKDDPLAALKDRQVYFAGYDDLTVGQDTIVELSNLPDNEEILIVYEILDAETMDVIYKTDLIPSSKHIPWVPAEDLEAGEHHIILHQMPFFPYAEADNGYLPLTNASNEITITVVE